MDALLIEVWVHLNYTSRWISMQMDLLRNLDAVSVYMLYCQGCRCTETLGHHGYPAVDLLLHSEMILRFHYGCPVEGLASVQ